MRDYMESLWRCVSFDNLTPWLRGPVQECFTTLQECIHQVAASAINSGNAWLRDYFHFQKYWRLRGSHFDNDKGLSAAVLQTITFDTIACDAILFAPLPIDMNVDDLDSVSLFRTASRTDSSTFPSSPKRRCLEKMLREPIDAIVDQILPPTTVPLDAPVLRIGVRATRHLQVRLPG
ncbi:hypothetical protein CYLTODRAFT_425503 [Cylindrobasidium torrendii FP15055 ss-10]|uniref:Uncharacterized protein n=1 Tax=Cylindrobasidium torrendii FP15055 ss-10 TaxID=1314674 RepID=A0A0D7B1M8_9AGAR|nr:hypothetical protein CYLTODRAFT_425503 [Cylindrobasidium torrendii FP15055 ss-10]